MKLLTGFIFLVSFFTLSLYFSPYVTSDDALNVLMAHSYHLPHDIYCWGQDRGGTLIPLISQLFIWIGFSPLMAVSLSNYFILSLGFYGFSKLFKSNFTKLIFALIWFIPFERFIYVTSFPIGMSYSLIGFSIPFLLNILNSKNSQNANWIIRNKDFLFLIMIWGIAAWISDLALFTIIILFSSLLLHQFKKGITKDGTSKRFAFWGSTGIILIFISVHLLKKFATGVTENYDNVNSLQEIILAIKMVLNDCQKVLFFGNNEILVSIGAWCLLAAFIYTIYQIIKHQKQFFSFQNVWLNFFLLDCIAIIGIIFLSHWVFLNNMGRWYFVATYISFSMLMLLFLDSKAETMTNKLKLIWIIPALLISISAVFSPIIKLKSEYQPMSMKLSELNNLGKIGIIADYWDAYRSSMVNPDDIKSTPHEGSDIKSPERIGEVFKQPKIYISRDMWFDQFPDSITQFGIKLKKYKSAFLLGGSNLCQYKIIPAKNRFEINDMKYDLSTFDTLSKILVAKPENKSLINKYFVFGPDISLLPGNYIIRYYCNSKTQKSKKSTPVVIDISSEYGKTINYFEEITNDRLYEKGYIDVNFKNDNLLQHAEFRILYKGIELIQFSRIEILKK